MVLALGPLGVGERPADAFDQLGREMGILNVGRVHALLQLKGKLIIPALDLGVGYDDDAWHVVLPSRFELADAREDQALTNTLDSAPGPLDATPAPPSHRGHCQRMRALPAGGSANDFPNA